MWRKSPPSRGPTTAWLSPPQLSAASRLSCQSPCSNWRSARSSTAATLRSTWRPGRCGHPSLQLWWSSCTASSPKNCSAARSIRPRWLAIGRWLASTGAPPAPASRARTLLDAAAACFAQAGADDERFEALFERLQISEAPDRATVRVAQLDALEKLAHTEAQRLQALAQRLGWRADHSQAGPELTEQGLQGMQHAWAIARPDLAFAFLQPLAWQLAMRGDDAAAVSLVEQHRDWVSRQADAAVRAQFHVALTGIHGYADRLLPAIEHAELALACEREAGNEPGVLPMLSNIGLYRFWRGELEAACTVLRQAQSLRDRLHGRGAALLIDINLACVLRDMVQYTPALELLQAALAEFQRVAADSADPHTDIVIAENHLASVWLALGDVDRAAAALSGDDRGVDLRFRARRLALRLRLARQCGRSDAHTLARARAAVHTMAPGFHRALVELELACALPDAAAALEFMRLHDEPPLRARPGMQAHALLRAAEAEARLGQCEAAIAHLAAAKRLTETASLFDMPPEEATRIRASVPEIRAHDQARVTQ